MAGKAWTYSSIKPSVLSNLELTSYDDQDDSFTKPEHVLVKVLNASLNPGDLKFPETPILTHFIRKPATPSFDFCGSIVSIPTSYTKSPDAWNLHVGQLVFGMQRAIRSPGSLKTLLSVHVDTIYPLPLVENIPVEHGSGLGVAALTAYQAIKPYAQAGSSVLITGGSGGVGTFAIQIAKALDMHVIVTCSAKGAKLCQDLGADELIDYTKTTISEALSERKVDLLVDCVGNDCTLHQQSEQFLSKDGHFVLVAIMAENLTGILSMLDSAFRPTWLGGVRRKWKLIFTTSATTDFANIADLATAGKLRVVVDKVFDFGDVPAAYKYLKSGRAKGKVLVHIAYAESR
ncbi:MAG: hypothetical protein GOMPHAMPRED_008012 [Gomphillus americanus]|uniref:Enoyl reductase (ER) domain-containing protein n=1 Tax=Gomphillus americanus TaxID=1940652 RepID=A0A8H3F0W6_9LECA|nr:MAG: hypothetical protein GOMPHAMPRED_008012 [Gomphillus americanus]